MAGAFQIPTLSLYLSSELDIAPAAVGFFYMANAAIGIVVGFILAAFSDLVRVRRYLLTFCYFIAVLNSLLFAFNRQYWCLLTIGSLLTAVANAATPQLFALAREYSEKPMFNALMRAQLSLAWVTGPPLAFTVTAMAGFKAMYFLTAVIFIAILLLSILLPVNSKSPLQQKPTSRVAIVKIRRKISLLFIASVLMWSCSAIYLIDIPVFITQQLGLAEQWVGFIMGLAAALEIPIMLLAGRYVARTGKKRMLGIAIYAGIIFYSGIIIATSVWQLLLLQVLNAVFIGIIATVGMFFFQAELPEKQGLATTLFTNSVSVGIVFAGGLHAFIIKIGQHEYVYVMAAALLFIARVILWRVDESLS